MTTPSTWSRIGQSAQNLVSPSYWGGQVNNFNSWLSQPSTAYQGTNFNPSAAETQVSAVNNWTANQRLNQTMPSYRNQVMAEQLMSPVSGPAFTSADVEIPGGRGDITAVNDVFTPLDTVMPNGPATANPVASPVNSNSFSPVGLANTGIGSTNPINNSMTMADPYSAYNQGYGNTNNTVSPDANSGGFWSGVGDTASAGWDAIGGWQGVQSGINTGLGIFQAYQGMEALDLANDKFNFQKDAWQSNYDMQKDAYDRQVAQVDSRKSFLQRGGSELEENQ